MKIVNIFMSVHVQNTRMTTSKLRQMKANGEKIAMLTSYDFTLASLVDEAGVDMILVGDSASNVVCGNSYTLPITVDEMIFLTKGVVRAAQHALVVCDMPFGSYQVSEEEAVRNAIKILKESGCDAVKLEGGEEILPAIRHMIQAGVPDGSLGTDSAEREPVRRLRAACQRRSRSRETAARCKTAGRSRMFLHRLGEDPRCVGKESDGSSVLPCHRHRSR